MKRIGIYLRVSTEEQARIQDGSLTSQRLRIIEFIESQNRLKGNWGQVVDIYCDEGKSAKCISARPEFKRLLTDVQTGRISLIIATELSRLSRSIRDFCEIWDLLKAHEASFITLRESFDTTTASGEMMVFNLINYAQYERKQTAERISANWQSRAKRGLFNGGTIPMGYQRNPKNRGELLVNEPEAQTVRMIFSLFLEKESLRKTCVALKEGGVFQKKFTNKHGIEKGGHTFTVDSLGSLLTNAAYIGMRPALVEGERKLITSAWKPLISPELFQKVQDRLKLNKNRYKPETWKKYPFPLTELITCGECGKHLGGKSGTGRIQKHFYYGHAQLKDPTKRISEIPCQIKNVRAPRLEDLVMKCLKSVLADPSLIAKWARIYREQNLSNRPESLAEMKRLDTEITQVKRKSANLIQRVADLPTDISADGFYDQIRQLTQKKDLLQASREKLNLQVRDMALTDVDEDGLAAKIKRAVKQIEDTPPEMQRTVFKDLIRNIEIHPLKLKIELYAPIKATGTDGGGGSFKKSDCSVLAFAPTRRAGSRSVGNGAPGQT
jgi:site-specific DNA recombinase